MRKITSSTETRASGLSRFPQTKIVMPSDLNSHLLPTQRVQKTDCGCRKRMIPIQTPRDTIMGVPNKGTNLETICNTDPRFRGIIGRFPVTLQPKDDRKKVSNTSISPYNNMVKFIVVDKYTDKDIVIGSGALIGPRHILTSAHVAMDFKTGISILEKATILSEDEQSGISQIYIPNEWKMGVPWKLNATNPSALKNFVSSDYALVVATTPLAPSNSNFFKYKIASAAVWNTKEVTHLGFPMNAIEVEDEEGNKQVAWPCFDSEVKRPDLFSPWNFGLCDGLLREQKLINSVQSYKGPRWVETYFDISKGHSGGPIFEKVGNEFRIYAIMSSIGGYCPTHNFAHRIDELTVSDLDESVQESGGL